jgi:hypothetical protein
MLDRIRNLAQFMKDDQAMDIAKDLVAHSADPSTILNMKYILSPL